MTAAHTSILRFRPTVWRWIGGFLLALSLLMPATAAPERPKTITVVMDDNFPPYIFRSQDGQLQGILKDTWDLWATKSGVAVRIVATDWNRAQKIMQANHADVIDTLYKNDERAERLDFSDPYAKLDTSIFFHKTISGIHSVNDLRGFAVGVKEGGATTAWLAAQGIGDLRKYPSYEAMVKAADNDEIRVFLMENAPAQYFLYKNKLENEFRHSEVLYSGQFHWATRKGNDALHQIVEQGFARITPDERERIESRWLGSSMKGLNNDRYVQYITIALLLGATISGALLLLSWTLRRKVALRTAELSAAMEALRISEQDGRMLFETSTLGLALCRMDGSIVDVNQAFADIIGRTIPETLRLTYWQITPAEYAQREQQQLDRLKSVGHYGPYEKEYLHKSGKRVPVRLSGTLIERRGEKFIWSSVEDITQYRATEERINFLAFHDALTGLPNRLLAQDRMDQAIALADRENTKVALLFLDLDNFKTVNDSLGHAAGDGLLKAVATRLTESLRGMDTISRQGGDEFLIIVPDLSDIDAVMPALTKVMNCLLEPFSINGVELTTSGSVGIAIYPDSGADFDTLLKNADIAMYHAKDSGRNSYRFFDDKMHVDAHAKLSMANGLRRALERNEFVLYYQPQIDLASGAVIGAEALIRWQHPENGLIPPIQFISLAEDSGLIVPIGDWVLREACRQAVEWHLAGAQHLAIAVNLSAVQFRRGDLEQSVIGAMESSGINPWLLELELTESILINNSENVLDAVRRLKALGVKLSIDDFGTGYSSLSYLKQFAVDKLKIDRSFIRDLTSDPEDAAIVRAIIQMARSLGLKTIAEGVENEAILDRLRLFHCDEAQGYHFAKPMPAEQFSAFLNKAGMLTK